MSIKTKISDGGGKGTLAKVSSRGQLITAPLAFSKVYNATAAVINTAYNIITPRTNKQFVITSVLLYANKSVGASDATVTVYEADASDTLTSTEDVFSIEMVKQTSLVLSSLNLILSEGKWLNIKTDDDDIFITVTGYYVEARPEAVV